MMLERFLNYVKIDTQSKSGTGTTPSTSKQLNLARILEAELRDLGLSDVHIDENGYVYGKLKGVGEGFKIGLIAHMDTAPDYSGEDVKPQIIENYAGGDIKLNDHDYLRISDFPNLENLIGNTLVTTDGTTLLGADNKAGIAIIMQTLEQLKGKKHCDISVCFTPDEEIGEGADHFNVEKFGADFAYTVDGGYLGEFNYENFNAASAVIKVNGTNIHPGSAKNKMKNSLLIAQEFNSLLPSYETPATTEGREGFFHLNDMNGNVENTEMIYIIRDHDFEKFTSRKALMTDAVEFINKKYGPETVQLTLKDSYFNMLEKFTQENKHIVDNALLAMINVGVEPKVVPIRGGTDGSRLSFMGLPTPNIFTGGENFHGRYEFVSVDSMKKSVETILEIIDIYTKKE